MILRRIFLFALLILSSSVAATYADDSVRPLIAPELLKPGDTVRVVAPAGVLDREFIENACRKLQAEHGLKIKMRDDLYSVEGYLAGSDERRAAELMEAFRDPDCQGVFCGTGGYGTSRILELLDYDVIRANPKVFMGFSDITALHAAFNRRAGLVTFHSPNLESDISRPEGLKPLTGRYFFAAMFEKEHLATIDADGGYTIEIPADAPQPIAWGKGKARGRLTGGNLSLVAALEGTPYGLDPEGAILLVEDTHEAPYRIDRMLRQLQLSGKLAKFRGAILGQFTDADARAGDEKTDDPRYSVNGVLSQYFEHAGIPVLMNFPVGHHKQNCTLPLGGDVEIDADAGTLRILPAP